MIEPLIYEFIVNCSVEHAFNTWTAKIDSWWPKDHRMIDGGEITFVLEGHLGGRITEQAADGRTAEWGRITRWDPPHALEYHWYAASSPDEPTEVQLTFTDQDGKTMIRIVHRGWDRFETDAELRRSRNEQGWDGLLDAYQRTMK